jgi:mannose PTS system EIIA component
VIGILLVAHGNLGESFIEATTHVLGARAERLAYLTVSAKDDPGELRARVDAAVSALDSGAGVLVLSDICGGTPCNVVTALSVPGKVEVISGLNLPMLLRALTYRGLPLAAVVDKALGGGAQGVMRLTKNT